MNFPSFENASPLPAYFGWENCTGCPPGRRDQTVRRRLGGGGERGIIWDYVQIIEELLREGGLGALGRCRW